MIEFHKIWIEQCGATRDIRDDFGLEKTLGYLIGAICARHPTDQDSA